MLVTAAGVNLRTVSLEIASARMGFWVEQLFFESMSNCSLSSPRNVRVQQNREQDTIHTRRGTRRETANNQTKRKRFAHPFLEYTISLGVCR